MTTVNPKVNDSMTKFLREQKPNTISKSFKVYFMKMSFTEQVLSSELKWASEGHITYVVR